MLALGVTVPFLDRDLLGSDVAIEAEHQDACSLPTHDHTICTQVVANLAAPSAGQEKQQQDVIVRYLRPSEVDVVVCSVIAEGHPSRAPPLA